jgi:hypothetical protein
LSLKDDEKLGYGLNLKITSEECICPNLEVIMLPFPITLALKTKMLNTYTTEYHMQNNSHWISSIIKINANQSNLTHWYYFVYSYSMQEVVTTITLFEAITMFCRTNNILQNIFNFSLNVRIILQNIVSPAEHCYGFEYYYDF